MTRAFALSALLFLLGSPLVVAQQATERYIPIGESPGASDKYSYQGTIVAVDEDEHTLTVEDENGRHTIKVAESTDIWLDNTARGRTNTTGTYADCEVGRKVEIMYRLNDKDTAWWIKIRNN